MRIPKYIITQGQWYLKKLTDNLCQPDHHPWYLVSLFSPLFSALCIRRSFLFLCIAKFCLLVPDVPWDRTKFNS